MAGQGKDGVLCFLRPDNTSLKYGEHVEGIVWDSAAIVCNEMHIRDNQKLRGKIF